MKKILKNKIGQITIVAIIMTVVSLIVYVALWPLMSMIIESFVNGSTGYTPSGTQVFIITCIPVLLLISILVAGIMGMVPTRPS